MESQPDAFKPRGPGPVLPGDTRQRQFIRPEHRSLGNLFVHRFRFQEGTGKPDLSPGGVDGKNDCPFGKQPGAKRSPFGIPIRSDELETAVLVQHGCADRHHQSGPAHQGPRGIDRPFSAALFQFAEQPHFEPDPYSRRSN